MAAISSCLVPTNKKRLAKGGVHVWFKNRIDAKILIEDFQRHFNETRPHSSLGNLTPAEFKRRLSTTNPAAAISEA
jgi:hypothetical protein